MVDRRHTGVEGLGEQEVAEAHHGDVCTARQVQSVHDAQARPRVGGEDRGDVGVVAEHREHRELGLLGLGVVAGDQPLLDLDPGRGEAVAVAVEPLGDGDQPGVATDEGDAAVPVGDQVGHAVAGGGVVVDQHGVEPVDLEPTVDTDHRDARMQLAQVAVVTRRGRDHQPPYLLHHQPLDLRPLALGVEAGAAEDHVEPGLVGHGLDGAGQRGEERVGDAVDDHADAVAEPDLEGAGEAVGHVVERLHCPLHAVAYLRAHVGLAAYDARDGLDADLGLGSDVVQRRALHRPASSTRPEAASSSTTRVGSR